MGGSILAVASDDPAVWYNVACAYAVMGKRDEALSLLAAVLRRLGFRTRMEIDAERTALEQFLRNRVASDRVEPGQ